MTNPNVPNPHGPNPNYTPNFDPNQYPEAAAAEYMLPTDPAEFKQQQAMQRRLLGSRVQMLEGVADKPAAERTDAENAQLMWAAYNMEPIHDKNGTRYFANVPYNSHPLSEGKEHALQDNERTRKVFEAGRHLLNEKVLKDQYDKQQAIKQEQADAQARADKHRKEIDDLNRKAQADAETIAKRTPAEKEKISRDTMKTLLAEVAANPGAPTTKADHKAIEASLKSLRPEELYRLELELGELVSKTPNPDNSETKASALRTSVGELRSIDHEVRHEMKKEGEARYEAQRNGELEPGDALPLGRFEQVKAEFEDAKLKKVEAADAAAAWDEAHPTKETDAMVSLHEFMMDHARRDRYHAQRSKRQERKAQNKLIELMANDARALTAFKNSGLAANKKISARVDTLLNSIEDYVAGHGAKVMRLDETDLYNLNSQGFNIRTKRHRAALRSKGKLGTYQEITGAANSAEARKLYNELQANRMPRKLAMMDAGEDKPHDTSAAYAYTMSRPRGFDASTPEGTRAGWNAINSGYTEVYDTSSPSGRKAYAEAMKRYNEQLKDLPLPEYGPQADPAMRMTDARREVIDRFEGGEPWGDTLSDNRFSNWLVRNAQRSELARAAKGDPAAEAELRRRGVRIPRLATNRAKNDARVDKINGAISKTTGAVSQATGKARRAAARALRAGRRAASRRTS